MEDPLAKLKGEPTKLNNILIFFCGLSPEIRTIDRLYEELQKTANDSAVCDKNLSKSSLQKACSKWHWIERAAIYDAQQQLKESKKYEAEFTRNNREVIGLVEDVLDYCGEALSGIRNNDVGYALSTQITLASTLMGIIDRANQNIRLCYGKPAKYNDKYDVELDNQLSVKEDEDNIFVKSNKELEEILSVNDDFDMEAFLEEQKEEEKDQ